MMNQKKFAQITGYSESTISKAFYNSKEINEETKISIINKAKELGIYDKFKKLNKNIKTIGIIVPEIKSYYYSKFVETLSDLISKKHAICNIALSNFSDGSALKIANFFSESNFIDGFISFDELKKFNNEHNTPLCIFTSHPNNFYNTINFDLNKSFEKMIKYYQSLGHKKFIFFGEKYTNSKEVLFTQLMKNNSISFTNFKTIISSSRFEKAGEECAKIMLDNINTFNPTAIICAYDYIAIGAINYLKSKNLTIPKDYSISGMNNIPACEYCNFNLSSIQEDFEKASELAIETIFKKINGNDDNKKLNITLDTNFVKRNSIGIAKIV